MAKHWPLSLLVAAAVTVWKPCVASAHEFPEQELPASKSPSKTSPAEQLKKIQSQKPPRLTSPSDVRPFIRWASGSPTERAQEVRDLLANVRSNAAVVQAFCAAVLEAQKADWTLALVALALLGEIRSPAAEACLMKFVEQPLPSKGTIIDGDILEAEELAMLQGKAVHGLAHLRTGSADSYVLRTAGRHASRIVRAEAIAAYLFAHDNSDKARRDLEGAIRAEEKIFLDRVVRLQGQKADDFNKRLGAFLAAHPEARPPPPTRQGRKDQPQEETVPAPPPLGAPR